MHACAHAVHVRKSVHQHFHPPHATSCCRPHWMTCSAMSCTKREGRPSCRTGARIRELVGKCGAGNRCCVLTDWRDTTAGAMHAAQCCVVHRQLHHTAKLFKKHGGAPYLHFCLQLRVISRDRVQGNCDCNDGIVK